MAPSDALIKLAHLMVESDQLHQEAIDKYPYVPGETPSPAAVALSDRLSALDRAMTRFSEQCAANPALTPHMLCWMVDIEGISDASSTLGMYDVVDMFTDPTAFAAKQGSMMLNIRTCLEQKGFKITDQGGGCGNWHLGVACDEETADAVCQLLFSSFSTAIESKMISVRRRFWKWRFKALYDAMQAYEYLEKISE